MTYRNGYYERDYTTLLIEVTFNEFLAISIKSSSITVPKPCFNTLDLELYPANNHFVLSSHHKSYPLLYFHYIS